MIVIASQAYQMSMIGRDRNGHNESEVIIMFFGDGSQYMVDVNMLSTNVYWFLDAVFIQVSDIEPVADLQGQSPELP
jgi:hypothetical protein